MIAGMKKANLFLVLVAALGYFVDIYDLILFSVVRVPSLKSMGLNELEILDQGIFLLNIQMTGMLIGGIIFGILGDRLGRVSVLFGSILLYSLANLANAMVSDVVSYSFCRFIAGFGLAGELGSGITLVAETLPPKFRGLGTTIVASVGVSGALVAWLVASRFDWKSAYVVGGCMGLGLLLLRMGVFESELFHKLKESEISRGHVLLLIKSSDRFKRFLGCIFIGIPIWYIIGILVTLAPEFAIALNVDGTILGGQAVFYAYSGLVVGDMCSGVLSQFLKSRKASVAVFLILEALGIAAYFLLRGLSYQQFYWLCGYLGFASGYWAMFATISAEQFGTNLRATAATSSPNFVRGSLVLVSSAFLFFKDHIGIVFSGALVGAIVLSMSVLGLTWIRESFSATLDFEER